MRRLAQMAVLSLSAAMFTVPSVAMTETDAGLTPSRAFAAAWIDAESTNSFMRLALKEKLARCVASGTMTQDRVDALRPSYDLYQSTLFAGLGNVREKVAEKAQGLLSAQDLHALARAFSTPVFRSMRKEVLAGVAQKLVPAVPGCGDSGAPLTISQLGAAALPKVRPEEMAQLRALAISPAFQHLNRAMPQLMPVLNQAYRDEGVHALQVVGASTAAQDRMRIMPSPILVDPPSQAPVP